MYMYIYIYIYMYIVCISIFFCAASQKPLTSPESGGPVDLQAVPDTFRTLCSSTHTV